MSNLLEVKVFATIIKLRMILNKFDSLKLGEKKALYDILNHDILNLKDFLNTYFDEDEFEQNKQKILTEEEYYERMLEENKEYEIQRRAYYERQTFSVAKNDFSS